MGNDHPPQPPSHPNWTQYGQPSYQPPTPPAPAPKPPRNSHIGWFMINGFILVVASSIGVLLLHPSEPLTNNGIGLGKTINTGPPPGVPYYTPAPTATPTGPQSITGARLAGCKTRSQPLLVIKTMTGPIPHYQFTLADGTPAGVCFCGTSHWPRRAAASCPHGRPPRPEYYLDTRDQKHCREAVHAARCRLRPDHPRPDVGPILVYTSADLAIRFC